MSLRDEVREIVWDALQTAHADGGDGTGITVCAQAVADRILALDEIWPHVPMSEAQIRDWYKNDPVMRDTMLEACHYPACAHKRGMIAEDDGLHCMECREIIG